MNQHDSAGKGSRPAASRRKLWGALIGALVGPFDTAFLDLLGVRFEINGGDASWFIALYFGLSFAVLGYLIGALLDARDREREQARLLGEQRDLINQTRARMAQSEKLAALGQMATMIAHEVRNPLGVMRSSAQEIRDAALDDVNSRRASSFLISEIDRLNRVIESILGFARPLEPRFDTVRVAEIAERAILLAAEHPRARHTRVRLERNGDPEVEADADLITQVLLDLIANALEASPRGGEVRIDVGGNGDVVVGVNDVGPGVPADLRDKIFQPFYTTNANGTGLGLAVSRQVVTSHGGTLSVADSAAGGARFEIRLPRHRRDLAA